jgi:hypothetical protein
MAAGSLEHAVGALCFLVRGIPQEEPRLLTLHVGAQQHSSLLAHLTPAASTSHNNVTPASADAAAHRGDEISGEFIILEPRDDAVDALLQATGRAAQGNALQFQASIVQRGGVACSCAAADGNAASTSARCGCGVVRVVVGLTLNMLEARGRGCAWRRSPAAALLFKQLLPLNADEGACARGRSHTNSAPITSMQQHAGSDGSPSRLSFWPCCLSCVCKHICLLTLC